MRSRFTILTAAALLSLIVPWCAYGEDGAQPSPQSSATPQCAHGCCFDSSTVLEGETLPLRGLSTFRYFGFRVYTGALYAPPAAQTRDLVRGETKKKLVLCYHRSLSTDQFRDKSRDVLEDTPGRDLNSLEPFLSAIDKAYVEVNEGDRYAITYTPSSGTLRLLLNEREPALVSIQNPSFAKAYFGIWISEHSVGEDFTAELFGENEAE
jgi:hypothetical protein